MKPAKSSLDRPSSMTRDASLERQIPAIGNGEETALAKTVPELQRYGALGRTHETYVCRRVRHLARNRPSVSAEKAGSGHGFEPAVRSRSDLEVGQGAKGEDVLERGWYVRARDWTVAPEAPKCRRSSLGVAPEWNDRVRGEL